MNGLHSEISTEPEDSQACNETVRHLFAPNLRRELRATSHNLAIHLWNPAALALVVGHRNAWLAGLSDRQSGREPQ